MSRITMKWIFSIIVCLLTVFTGCAPQTDIPPRDVAFSDSAAGIVNVMTFNIRYGTADDGVNHWDYRRQVVFDVIADHAADVVGLQEALDFQVDQISEALPQYDVYFVGRDDGQRAGEGCAILYRRDCFELADSGTFWFSNMPWKVASKHWGNTIPRICSWVRLINKADGKGIYVYNLHLDHRSQNSREKSMRLLAKRIALRPEKEPYVVMGDFNMDLNNPAMMYLQKIGFDTPYPRLVSAWLSVHPKDREIGTYHGFDGGDNQFTIDHILVEEGVSVLKSDVDRRSFEGRYPSDHYPVSAQIKLY